MLQQWVTRLGPAYIVWMMIATRLCGLIGGALVVYYVGLTCELTGRLGFHWQIAGATVVLGCVTLTVFVGLWETRRLRAVMRLLHLGHPFPAELGQEAGREAVVFPIRHHLREAPLTLLFCLPPVYVHLRWAADAPTTVLIHITIATFMGVAVAVSVAYFVIERLMHPVVRHLMDYGVVVDYENLPTSRLYKQLLFSFSLTILTTAVMITTLATQKASKLVDCPGELDQVVRGLRIETIAISGCAVLMALALSTFLAKSVSIPVQDMLRAMRRVEAGSLTERITAISTNEIGMLGRSFNRMVERLEENQAVIQELNASLERKVRERTQELRLAQDRLVHSEKMTSLGELVAGIAHEINNSVNAVYNGIIPLREKLERLRGQICPALDPAAAALPVSKSTPPAAGELRDAFSFVHDLAEVVESGAKRAASIVSDLKKFGHPGEDRRSVFDVHEGLQIALNLLHNKMKNRVEIRRDFCEDGKILCSGTQLTQVFLNVLDNAQQAIADKGCVCISTRKVFDQMVIRIRDTGTGIPEDIRGRIFDPFFTTKEVGVGTGLGLSISYGIVKGHGGSVDVTSPPPGHEHGSEFTITLPVAADEATAGGDSANRSRDGARVSNVSERTQAVSDPVGAPASLGRTTP
jgi:signal transduction histidine kinase